MQQELRKCKKCLLELTLDDFYINKGWRSTTCKKCHCVESTQWRKANPDKNKIIRRRCKLKEKYGISLEQYAEMFKSQNGVCKICEKEHTRRPLNVDHYHSTGAIRGLLCDKCNMAIGLFDDDPNLLEKTIKYLENSTY